MTDTDRSAAKTDPRPPSRLARVGPFHDVLDVNLALARLRDDGIKASVTGESLSTTLGPLYGAAYAGGPFLLVAADDEAAARAIVAEVERSRRTRVQASCPPCPACGGGPTARVLPGLRWAALALMAVGVLTLSLSPFGIGVAGVGLVLMAYPVVPAWKCAACGRRLVAPIPHPTED